MSKRTAPETSHNPVYCQKVMFKFQNFFPLSLDARSESRKYKILIMYKVGSQRGHIQDILPTINVCHLTIFKVEKGATEKFHNSCQGPGGGYLHARPFTADYENGYRGRLGDWRQPPGAFLQSAAPFRAKYP